MTEWYYSLTPGIQEGPVDAEDLALLHADGQLRPDSLVWREGMSAWAPWREVMAQVLPASAAASIVAKVSRDRLMMGYHDEMPHFGFDSHKGYPTKAHKAAIALHGPSLIHRRTFKGVSEHIASNATARADGIHVR